MTLLTNPPGLLNQEPRRTPSDVADDFMRAREAMQRQTAVRRTLEAQADIAAAHAAPTGIEVAMQEIDRAVEQAEIEHLNAPTAYRAHGDPPVEITGLGHHGIPLDAALSNAALADTPAVREMGGPAKAPAELFDVGMVRGLARAAVMLEQCGFSEKWPLVDRGAGTLWDTTAADALAMARKLGLTGPAWCAAAEHGADCMPPCPAAPSRRPYAPLDPGNLPPGAVLLTGPEAERYRALQDAARKAQASAATARADGAALLQLFQAFCAGVTPGEEP